MATKAVAKPQLRRLLETNIKRNLTIAIGLSFVAGAAYKWGVLEARKKKYAEFYKNYDADKEFERMKKAGVFQSC
ncbi:cytochrome c oxidase subunit 6C [Homalodisca vitripennis]|uniref:cytochrome c oxidase subunit 6C n=1 Tax=Homalodisca vitripennis TaxID=197043 RepID=UPI001EECC15C|nr:cytochrome c oxidase subunit 6C [Homalodisca vitripennis]KAG8310501.1 Cytochrome c oxidase subunit [Homalodisca vitripennis]